MNDGFYSNRTDFIRTIRNYLDQHRNAVAQSIARQRLELGLRHYGRNELEAVQSAGETLAIQVLGLVVIGNDVTPDLGPGDDSLDPRSRRLADQSRGESGIARRRAPEPATPALRSRYFR